MPEGNPRLNVGGPARALTRRRITLAAALVLMGAIIGFSARCGVAALFVNAGNLALVRGADNLAASAFEAASAIEPASQATSNFRLSQALTRGDFDQAADELAALRARGGAPRGVAPTSSVLLHLDAILARRAGEPARALTLIRQAASRAGANAPQAALRLLDELSRTLADRPYGPALATVALPVDPRRDTCGDGRRLARVRLLRNDIAAGGPVRVDLKWTDAAGRPTDEDTRRLRNLVPNGAFAWGVTSANLPLGYTAHPQPPSSGAVAPGDIHVGFADLDGQPVSALIIDNLDGPPRTSRLRSAWIPAAPGACYLFASEVWVAGGQPHFGLFLRAPGHADTAVFGLQGGLPDGWRRGARLLRLPPDIQAVQVFFWNFRSGGATAFTLAVVARLDAQAAARPVPAGAGDAAG